MTSRRIPAVYMRGGSSKGVFFHGRDLPYEHAARDAILLRVIGSPDPSGLQVDGLGGATQGTSKVAIVTPSRQDDCDVDYLFGAVAIDAPAIDWSGSCSHLCAAVGPFAISEGLVPAVEGITRVRIWQANLGRRIDAFVPVRGGEAIEAGVFVEDGVPFPSSEVRLEFLDPGGDDDGAAPLLPTGAPQDELDVPGLGRIAATMLVAGSPTVFVRASALGLTGREQPAELARSRRQLERLEAVRAAAAVRMGYAGTAVEATRLRPSTPGLAWIARPAAYRIAGGGEVSADRVDLLARAFAGGRMHAAYPGAGAIALAVAAALPGTLVAEVARTLPGVPTRIGHPAGTSAVGAEVSLRNGAWRVDRAVLSRGARRLMSGVVHVPPAGLSRAA